MILALDQGTTSSRAIVFDERGCIVSVAQQDFKQHFPRSGWVEHDANEIWTTQRDTAQQALRDAKLDASDIAAIGITNQRETTVLWDRSTGEPVSPAIVWQDRRTAGWCDELRAQGFGDAVQQRTGLIIDAYFSGSKLRWLLDHVDGAQERAQRGELAFGTIDTWLIWKLTAGQCHVTDATNASRTMLYNLADGAWDATLLEKFNIPRSLLPSIIPSSGIVGHTVPAVLGSAVPIAGVAGDQQAALFGQCCFERGLAKNTFGTGCFMLMNVGSEPSTSQHRLLSTVAWQRESQRTFALEGSVFVGGAVVQWLRDGLGIIKSSSEVEKLAASVKDTGGVYLVPAFAGLGAPYWDQYARGTIVGLTRGTTAAHIARAALEGIAFQVADVLDVMRKDSGITLKELRVDGGAASNDLLMQFQADLLRVPVVRPRVTETTALGVACLAGLAVGFWPNLDAVRTNWQPDRTFEPAMSEDQVAHRRERWSAALARARDWVVDDDSDQ